MKNHVFHALRGSNILQDRQIEDFYGTPPHATRQLLVMLKKHGITLDKPILEPFAGTSLISDVLHKQGLTIHSADYVDRGYRIPKDDTTGSTFEIRDFFSAEIPYDDFHIISNPPYKKAFEAIKKCLFYTKPGNLCIIILNIRFLEGLTRYQFFKQCTKAYLCVC